jgi:ferritin-like metal-binding protein YciE
MTRNLLIAWLNDAYAMEQALLPVLEQHAKDAEGGETPEAGIRIREHIEETRKQIDRLDHCLAKVGSRPSMLRSSLGSVMGSAQTVMTAMFSDKAVKNAMLDSGIEQFEIAAYRALITAAKEMDEDEIATLCEDNMHEEQMMATWLEDRIPVVVRAALGKRSGVGRA